VKRIKETRKKKKTKEKKKLECPVSTNGLLLAERDQPICASTLGGLFKRNKREGTTLKIDNPIRQPVTHQHVPFAR
jgi:hypothetical protein